MKKIYAETFCGEYIPAGSTHVKRTEKGQPLQFFHFGGQTSPASYGCLSLEYLRIVCPEQFEPARCVVPKDAQFVWQGENNDIDLFYKIKDGKVFCSTGMPSGDFPFVWQKSVYTVADVEDNVKTKVFKKKLI